VKFAQLVNRLLLIIAIPTRLLECLEFDVEDASASQSAEESQQRLRFLQESKYNSHIPQYVISRLSTHFGAKPSVPTTEGHQFHLETSHSFVNPEYRPAKHDFKFEKLLSAGAYGAVYLARHIKSKEQVAIKVLKKKDVLAKNLMDQVLHERDIMQFAQNPFLINLLCSFSSKVCIDFPRYLCLIGFYRSRCISSWSMRRAEIWRRY
jgi:microtubule-associated serine/threonine kinase